jgi:hypothetical protein
MATLRAAKTIAVAISMAVAAAMTIALPAVFGQSGISMSSPQSAPSMPSPQAGGRGSIGIGGPPARGFGERGRGRGFNRGPVFLYGSPYYSDYYQHDEREAPALTPPPPVPAAVAKSEPLPDPVLLELRGNKWVQVKGFDTSSGPASVSPVAKQTPPAVLVFRDGHNEEVSSYSIIDGAIYTRMDYWTQGTWSRKIEIGDLDVPATLKQNQQRGVKFQLPSGPNEVMIRP